MIKKLKNLNAQFLVIALSLVVITTVLGLSAYIVDTEVYQVYFRTAAGADLEFSVSGEPFPAEEVIVCPGDEVFINAKASVTGQNPVYMFIKREIPSDFAVNGFNSSCWIPLDDRDNIYYFGTENGLIAVGGDRGIGDYDILSSLALSETAKADQDLTFTITGYAIQQRNLEEKYSDPAYVYSLIADDSTDDNTGG